MTVVKKSLQVKWYDRSGTFLKLEDKLKRRPTWQFEQGRGAKSMTLSLDYEYDDLPSHIQSNNIVKVFEISSENPRGLEVYSGIIGEIRPFLQSSEQGVDVEVLGKFSVMLWSYFKSGASYTVSYAATDVAQIIKDIIDDWQAVHSSTLISYTALSIDTTGNVIDLDFVNNKHGDALETVAGYLDSDWYWYIDLDGVVYVKEKPTTATYTLTVGRDVEVSESPLTYKQIINSQTVNYNGGTVTVTDASSISSYGLHEGALIEDLNINSLGTATVRATTVVTANKDPKVNGVLKPTSLFGELPNARPGRDSVQVKNLRSGSVLNNNLPIVAVGYNWDNASWEIGEQRANLPLQLTKLIKSVT